MDWKEVSPATVAVRVGLGVLPPAPHVARGDVEQAVGGAVTMGGLDGLAEEGVLLPGGHDVGHLARGLILLTFGHSVFFFFRKDRSRGGKRLNSSQGQIF